MALLSRLARISLLWKFALVNLIPILLLGLVLQHYLSEPGLGARDRRRDEHALSISRSEVERFISEHDLATGSRSPRSWRSTRRSTGPRTGSTSRESPSGIAR